MTTEPTKLEAWAIVELMGHVKMAGRVTEEERFGAKMGRIDIPMQDGGFTTQYFGGGSVYRMTPTSEEVARAVAGRNQPAPIYAWEMPKQLPASAAPEHSQDEDEDDDFNDQDDLVPGSGSFESEDEADGYS